MGSFFAGVKAGTLAGVVYVGGLALCNVLLLYALKGDVLEMIRVSFSTVCTPTAGANATTVAVEDCFSSVVVVYVPLMAFLAFFVSIVYAGLFGWQYEHFPGSGPGFRGATIGVVVGLNLVFFNLVGIFFDVFAKVAIVSAFVALTLVYGILIGRLYRRYTREVRFASKDSGGIRIMVDNKDCTGRTKTFAAKSTHKVRAEADGGASFKEWAASGGVKLEDPRSFETVMDVEGDGVLGVKAAPQA